MLNKFKYLIKTRIFHLSVNSNSNDKFDLNKIVDDLCDRKLSEMNNSKLKKSFYNKIVVINGATGTIGSDLSQSFALEDAKVVLCGRNEEKLKSLQSEIKNKGFDCDYVVFDMTVPSQIENSMNKIYSKYGRIDVLVNCAGESAREEVKPLYQQEINVIERMLNLNLMGPILCSKFASKIMVDQKFGSIINFSSLMGIKGKEGYVDYGAAKSGILGLTKCLAIELGKYNINVNCVTPSYVPSTSINENRLKKICDSNYMNTTGCTSDITACVKFLASDEAKFITGQNIIIDGGRSLGMLGE